MFDKTTFTDRRTFPRFTGDDLDVVVRRRGRLGRMSATVLDFNRFGMALLTAQPLPKDQEVFITLCCGEARIDNLVGVVHTCFFQDEAFRCGIQFRTASKLQFDKNQVESALMGLEIGFVAAVQPSVAAGTGTSASH